MKAVIKRLWVKALRSGKFSQTTGALKSKNSYCCLGVLCRLHAQETGNRFKYDDYFGNGGLLPKEVMSWAGLRKQDPQVVLTKQETDDKRTKSTLAACNDDFNFNFKQIAKIIQREL